MMNKVIDFNKKLKIINFGFFFVVNNCFSWMNMIFEVCGFSNFFMNINVFISL